jgi:uncharacterized membrane-anchored protein YitT (DUF2179 family)
MASEPLSKEEISFTEGVQYASLGLSVATMLAYLAIVLTRVFTDDVSVTKVAWQGPMLLILIIGGLLYGIGYGVARLRHRGTVEDARDKEIRRYGESINGGLAGLTIAVSIVLLALGVEPFWVAHNLFFGSWFASFVSTAGRAAAYREGIPA